MTVDEAKHKMDFLKKAYQKLIDEKVDSGKLIGDGVMGEWKAETPIDEAYKSMIEALEMAIKALEQTRWIPVSEKLPEPDMAVLLYVKYKSSGQWTYQLGMWNDIRNWWEDWRTPYQLEEEFEVIAWMELPEKYEEDSHE